MITLNCTDTEQGIEVISAFYGIRPNFPVCGAENETTANTTLYTDSCKSYRPSVIIVMYARSWLTMIILLMTVPLDILSRCLSSINATLPNVSVLINTYWLRPWETVCFVDPRLSMFPEVKLRKTYRRVCNWNSNHNSEYRNVLCNVVPSLVLNFMSKFTTFVE